MLTIHQHTYSLFQAPQDVLFNVAEDYLNSHLSKGTRKVTSEIKSLRTYYKNDYHVGLYGQFGSGHNWRELKGDLGFFIEEQKRRPHTPMNFWAVFEEDEFFEDEFQAALWRELSFLTCEDNIPVGWSLSAIPDLRDPGFAIQLHDTEFFVIGLHSESVRDDRRFFAPSLVFQVRAEARTQ